MTVVARRIRATPERSSVETWQFIVDLIVGSASDARRELEAIAGVAASLIADETPRDAPIVVAGAGPRLRIYCLYGEDAITGEESNEGSLTWDATDGDWRMWLPASGDDLTWITAELSKRSPRISAYDLEEDGPLDEAAKQENRRSVLSVNPEAFKRP